MCSNQPLGRKSTASPDSGSESSRYDLRPPSHPLGRKTLESSIGRSLNHKRIDGLASFHVPNNKSPGDLPNTGGLQSVHKTHNQIPSTAVDWNKLIVTQLKPYLRKWGLPVSGRKAELIERLMNHQRRNNSSMVDIPSLSWSPAYVEATAGESPINTNLPQLSDRNKSKWKGSKAKAYLKTLLTDKNCAIHRMSAEDVWNNNAIFQEYPLHRFKVNFKNLKEAIEERRNRLWLIEKIHREEQIKFLRSQTTNRGIPFWDTHPASTFLRMDLKEDDLWKVEPRHLRLTRMEYQDFPSDVFAKHVHQEKRKFREKPYWIPKRNKDAQRRLDEQMKQWKEDWDAAYINQSIDNLTTQFADLST